MKNLKHFGKRGLAVLIALVMCLSLLPMSAFASAPPNVAYHNVYVPVSDHSKAYAELEFCFSYNNDPNLLPLELNTYNDTANGNATVTVTETERGTYWYNSGSYNTVVNVKISGNAVSDSQAKVVIDYVWNNGYGWVDKQQTNIIYIHVYEPETLEIAPGQTVTKPFRGTVYGGDEAATTEFFGATSGLSAERHFYTEDYTITAKSTATLGSSEKVISKYGYYSLPGYMTMYVDQFNVTIKDPTPPHTHDYTWTSNGDKTHNGTCSNADGKCDTINVTSEACADTTGDGFCDKCGACTHTQGSDGYCTDPNCTHDSNCTCGGKGSWTCNHEKYSDGTCKEPDCTHKADGHDCCEPHEWHRDGDDDGKCDICGESTVCFHPAGQCGDECKHPADCQCKKHVHKDEDPVDGKCDEDGACMHDKGQCGSECGHDDDCQCKHQHADANNDGKCDVCGKCLHEKDAAGYDHHWLPPVPRNPQSEARGYGSSVSVS